MRKVKIKDLKVGDTIYCKDTGTLEGVKSIDLEKPLAKTYILQWLDDETFEPDLKEIYFTFDERTNIYLMDR